MRKYVLFLLIALSWAGLIYSQERTGNIYGTVLDENNQPIPGVTVSVKSDATGINLSTLTSAEGKFRFLSLPPGKDYTVKCELEGFETVVQSNIKVTVGVNTSLSFTMKLGKIDTVVEVVAATPLIDPLKATVASNVTRDTLQELPTARDPWVILQLAPGVMVDRENIGGNESGQQSNFSGRGDSGDNAQWNIDGVNISDPAAVGASPMYYDFDMFEEMQIQTAANDVTAVTGGININFVTKRGGDKFSGGGRFYFTSEDLQSENVTKEVKEAGLVGNRVHQIMDYGFNVGGPISKSKFWFWGSAGFQNIQLVNITGARDDTDLKTYNLKLNSQLGNHRLEFYTVFADKVKDGRRRTGGYLDDRSATWHQTGPSYVFKIQDEFTVGRDLFLSAKFSYSPMGFKLEPIGGRNTEVYRDVLENRAWNTYLYYETGRPQIYTDFLADYYKENILGGNHEFKFGVEYKTTTITSQTGYGNGGYGYLRNGEPYRVRIWRHMGMEYWAQRFSAYAQDLFTRGRLTLNLGIRFDRQWGGVNDFNIPANNIDWARNIGGVDYNFPSSIQEAEKYNFTWNFISPRLGATYDISGNGKTVARANFSIYGSQLTPDPAYQFYNYGFNQFRWNDVNGDQKIQANELTYQFTYDYRGSLFDAKHLIDPNLSPERTFEFLAGVEREVAENFAVGANFIYRKMDQYNWSRYLICKNANTWCSDGQGNPVPDEFVVASNDDWVQAGVISVPGYGNFTFWDLDYSKVLYWSGSGYYTKRPDFWQDYKGLEITVKKRLSKKWMVDSSVTFQTWKVHYDSRNSYQDPTDHLPVDMINGEEFAYQAAGSGAVDVYMNSKWLFKMGAMYQLPYDINISGVLIARQGYILPLKATDPSYEKEVLNYEPAEVLIQKFGANRLPNMYLLNIRIEKLIDLKDKGRLYASFDGFNLTNTAIALARQRDASADNFLQDLQIMSPRLFRIGIRYEF